MRLIPIAVALIQVTILAQGRVPAPDSVFGFSPGADSKLATYDQPSTISRSSMRRAIASRLVEAGTSTQGRTYYFALVSSKANLKKIDRYREIARRLARPEGLTEAEARRAGARRQAARPHRRRAALDRSGGSAAHACCSRTICWRSERSADRAHPRQRHPDAVADDQSRRPPDGRRLVHEERGHAGCDDRCRGSTRNTSATTTTATPTCST